MATTDRSTTAPRLDFLRSSARALCSDSPSTASYLLASHNSLLFEQQRPLTVSQEREICPACGTPRIPGLTSNISTVSGPIRKKTRGASNRNPETRVAYKCLRCHREVIQSFLKPPRSVQKPAKQAAPSSQASPSPAVSLMPDRTSTEPTKPTTEKKASENASSKKRAKARKNLGLLATITASKQQQPQPKSSSLDLFDFLQ